MKHPLRVMVLVVAIVTVMSALVLSTSTASKKKKSGTAQSAAAKAPRTRRPAAKSDPSAPMRKSLRMRGGKMTEGGGQETPGQTQEPKLAPDVFMMIGPVSQDEDLRNLPYIPVTEQEEEE